MLVRPPPSVSSTRAGDGLPSLGRMHAESIGRWRRNLTPQQVEEVEAEAGELMEELGYS